MEPSRREALFQAMLEELVQRGYREMSVARAREETGVSTEEFEAEFGDKDECLFATYDWLTEQVLERAGAGCEGGEPWPDRVRSGLVTLLDEFAARPDVAKAVMRAFPGIRPSAYERYVALLSRFVPLMREGREYSESNDELPTEVELLAVGAAEAIIFTEVEAGRTQSLPRLMPEILFSVLVPFLGPDRAADEMRLAAAIR